MRAATLLTTFVIGAWLVQGDPDPEKTIKDIVKGMEDATAVLKTVKDERSAEAAVPKLEEAMKRLSEACAAENRIRLGDPAFAKQTQKHVSQLSDANRSLKAEDERLAKQRELQKILFKSPAWAWAKYDGLSPRSLVGCARMDIKTLETGVLAFYLKKGYLPETLQQLTKRDPIDNSPAIFASDSILKDPWGRNYLYDPGVFHPQTDKPLIYSVGPDPKTQDGRISNWD